MLVIGGRSREGPWWVGDNSAMQRLLGNKGLWKGGEGERMNGGTEKGNREGREKKEEGRGRGREPVVLQKRDRWGEREWAGEELGDAIAWCRPEGRRQGLSHKGTEYSGERPCQQITTQIFLSLILRILIH